MFRYLIILFTMIFFLPLSVLGQSNSLNSGELNYVPNQIIVAFKPQQSFDVLQLMVNERLNTRKTFFGKIKLFFADLGLKINKKDSPEEKLARLNLTNDRIGVIKKEILTTTSGGRKDSYVLTTNGTVSVEKMVQIYSKLPEVEYAEPNYIYSTLQY